MEATRGSKEERRAASAVNVGTLGKGKIATIVLSRPKKKNAINGRTYLELAHAFAAVSADPGVSIIVLSGEGDYFCSGADLSEWADMSPATTTVQAALAPVRAFMHSLLCCPKVVVAAVNGPAVGIGVTLLAHCDLVYAAPSATFWVPFLRAAIVPEFASSVTFPRIMGPAMATDMLLTSRKLSADEAVRARLVSDIIPAENFLSDIYKKMDDVLQQPLGEKSVLLFKKMLREKTAKEMEAVVEEELAELGRRYASGETGFAVGQLMKPSTKDFKSATAQKATHQSRL